MNKNSAFYVVSGLIGALTYLLGFPIVKSGTIHVESVLIILVLDAMFYVTIYSKRD